MVDISDFEVVHRFLELLGGEPAGARGICGTPPPGCRRPSGESSHREVLAVQPAELA